MNLILLQNNKTVEQNVTFTPYLSKSHLVLSLQDLLTAFAFTVIFHDVSNTDLFMFNRKRKAVI